MGQDETPPPGPYRIAYAEEWAVCRELSIAALRRAPIAIVIDSLSFLCSAAALSWLKVGEARPAPDAPRAPVWREIREGLEVVWQSRLLRALLGVQVTL